MLEIISFMLQLGRMINLKILRILCEQIFPQICPGCDSNVLINNALLCQRCLLKLPRTDHFRSRADHADLFTNPGLVLSMSCSLLYFRKGGITQSILHEIKYKKNQKLALFMGRLIGKELKESPLFIEDAVLVPVPIHPKKLKIRGYNQSELIAEGISVELGIPVNKRILFRRMHSQSQTKMGRSERFENLTEVFTATFTETDDCSHLILIDDVITTGATCESCLAAIKKTNTDCKLSLITLAIALSG